jgi:hypothetical protein
LVLTRLRTMPRPNNRARTRMLAGMLQQDEDNRIIMRNLFVVREREREKRRQLKWKRNAEETN